ncbi:hypothetical protein SADUNF_Sadunf10G0026800 [Salix dunnii]|uniref:Uncharacterized protein n=1 Tax=Salix dunnii TaxID=1413687 RepID=A0A835MU21_9ROSI|nr:hypothetical protein SADUNF_Sadunf10G0026800 [Salix dunnii]
MTFLFEPSTLSVVRTATLRPNTEIAKSIMSSADPTQRLVSPGLGALSHSSTASKMIRSMLELSLAWKISFI